jgi:hypothetical protein
MNREIENARLAYTIIQSLLKTQEVTNNLLALMAQTLDEEITKALTATSEWEDYLEAKRELEITKKRIELFVTELKKLNEEF